MNRMQVSECFSKNTIHGESKHGFYVKCKKGLWRVVAPTKKQAENEAMHYFWQYFMDGEYDH